MIIGHFSGQESRGDMSKVYVLGGAQTDFMRNWTKEGKGMVALLKEVMTDGLADANITYDDVRKLNIENRVEGFVANFIAEKYVGQGHLGAFLTEIDSAFYGVPSARYEGACASSSVAIDAAQSKIKAGDCDLAIVVGWEIMKSVDSKTGGDILGYGSYWEKESKGIDFPFPKLFGKLADETIKKYNLDAERYLDNLARISVMNYGNAKRNPLAQTRKWFMNFDQASTRNTETNPLVGGLLGISDCSQTTDGAVVIVLASEKFAKERGLQDKPYIKGYGHRNAPLRFDIKMKEAENSKYILPWTRQTVVDAYKRSGLTVDDIDVFEAHDCFTSSEYVQISLFGLTEPGKEYEAIESGMIAFDGPKPFNPSGGLIGCGHPIGASSARMFLDCYKQVAGLAGKCQIKNARNAMMLNIGGTASTNYAFIIGR